jgi:hypothetical protein
MKKQAIIIGIILISINLNAQITEKILSTKQNIAYFDSICVFQNLIPVKQLNEKTFVTKTNDTILLNDFKLIIKSNKRTDYYEENSYGITYECIDEKNNLYYFTIYYAYGQSWQACLIAMNTNMRYGFSHNN